MTIRHAKREDFYELAIIYKSLYDGIDLGETWSIESAIKLCEYWYKKQRELFFVAEEDGRAVGAIMSGIKPWFDGNRLVDTELFVSKSYQNNHIAKELFRTLLLTAREDYSCNVIEFHTYGNEDGFPQCWYRRLGCKKDDRLIVMFGNVSEISSNLE